MGLFENKKENENKKMQANTEKKKYIYLALDPKTNMPIVDPKKDGSFIFSTVTTEGSKPKLNDNGKRVNADVRFLDSLRIEMIVDPNSKSKDPKREAKEKVWSELIQMANNIVMEAAQNDSEENVPDSAENQNTDENEEKNTMSVADIDNQDFLPEADALNDNSSDVSEDTQDKVVDDIKEEDTITIKDVFETVEVTAEKMRADNSKIYKVVNDTESKLKQTYDLLSGVARGYSSLPETIKKQNSAQNEALVNNQRVIDQSIKKNTKLTQEISERTETLEGQLKKLDRLEEIADILIDKGIEIRKTAAPTSREEEDILNMSKYAVAIIDQLTVASCELIKRQAAFEQKENGQEAAALAMQEQLNAERDFGIKFGKMQILKNLFNKFENADGIINAEDPVIKIIWNSLTEQGVSIDGEGQYYKGNEVEIAEADVEKMAAKYTGISEAGAYVVSKSGLSFEGEIIFNAEFEKKDE